MNDAIPIVQALNLAHEELADTIAGVGRIEPKKVSKVIKIIDEIAFQTNILALNAAVEARGPANPAWALRWSPTR